MQHEPEGRYILERLQNDLPGHLHYHTVAHTMDVYNRAEDIAKRESVSAEDKRLLLVAALYHDSGYLYQRVGHEQKSCSIAREALPKFGYGPEDIDKICKIIMATKLPQNPQSHLEKIICDADLDYLGRDDFFETGHGLYLEMRTAGVVDDDAEWNRLQESFLKEHRYFTKTTISLRQAKKQENYNTLLSKLKNQ